MKRTKVDYSAAGGDAPVSGYCAGVDDAVKRTAAIAAREDEGDRLGSCRTHHHVVYSHPRSVSDAVQQRLANDPRYIMHLQEVHAKAAARTPGAASMGESPEEPEAIELEHRLRTRHGRWGRGSWRACATHSRNHARSHTSRWGNGISGRPLPSWRSTVAYTKTGARH